MDDVELILHPKLTQGGDSVSRNVVLSKQSITKSIDFSFVLKRNADLLGADLYVEFWCVRNTQSHLTELNKDPNNYVRVLEQQHEAQHVFQFGINSFFHWMYGKEIVPEDKFFASSGLLDFNDRNQELPKELAVDWKADTPILISFKGDRASVSVKGRSIPILKDGSDASQIPASFWTKGFDGAVISFSLMNLGEKEYAVVRNGGGTFGIGVYAQSLPAVPVVMKRDFRASLLPWMLEYNKVTTVVEEVYTKEFGRDFYFRDRLLFEERKYPPQVYPPQAGSSLKAKLETAIGQAKYQGRLDLETAILMGAIDLPPDGDALWTGIPNPPEVRRVTEKRRKYITQELSLRDPNGFALERLLNEGRYDIAVQYEFILPHILLKALNNDLSKIDSSEREWIPDPRQCKLADSIHTLKNIDFSTE